MIIRKALRDALVVAGFRTVLFAAMWLWVFRGQEAMSPLLWCVVNYPEWSLLAYLERPPLTLDSIGTTSELLVWGLSVTVLSFAVVFPLSLGVRALWSQLVKSKRAD
jgi:hypothetical protein